MCACCVYVCVHARVYVWVGVLGMGQYSFTPDDYSLTYTVIILQPHTIIIISVTTCAPQHV